MDLTSSQLDIVRRIGGGAGSDRIFISKGLDGSRTASYKGRNEAISISDVDDLISIGIINIYHASPYGSAYMLTKQGRELANAI